MTQRWVFTCDRCGREAPSDPDQPKWASIELREQGKLSQFDLCPLCTNAVKRELRPRQPDA